MFFFSFVYFGNERISVCDIMVCGQGPIVSIFPEVLDFEEVKLLNWTSKNMLLQNDAPIPARVCVKVNGQNFNKFIITQI